MRFSLPVFLSAPANETQTLRRDTKMRMIRFHTQFCLPFHIHIHILHIQVQVRLQVVPDELGW
jgi:hypothetical protein